MSYSKKKMKKKEKKTFGCYNLRSTSSEVCFTHVPFHILSLFGFVYNLFVCCIWSELFYLIRRLLKYLSRFAHLFESPTSESINLLLEGLIFCAPGHLSNYTKTYNVRPDHSSPHFLFSWSTPPPPPPPPPPPLPPFFFFFFVPPPPPPPPPFPLCDMLIEL